MSVNYTRPRLARAAPPLRQAPAARLQRPARRASALPNRTEPPRLLPWRGRYTPPVPTRLPLLARAPVPAFVGAPDEPSGWDGPNPYGDFQRIFTLEGGIKLIFKVKDLRAWRWWVRAFLWGTAMVATVGFAAHASPYPLVPPGCRLFEVCAAQVPTQQSVVNYLLLGLMGLIYAHILFVEEESLSSIEIRPDCMIIDDADVFWKRHMDLGWPEIGYDSDCECTTLNGVYGTRKVVFVQLHEFDDHDRTIQVLGFHLTFAMQQLWDPPGGTTKQRQN